MIYLLVHLSLIAPFISPPISLSYISVFSSIGLFDVFVLICGCSFCLFLMLSRPSFLLLVCRVLFLGFNFFSWSLTYIQESIYGAQILNVYLEMSFTNVYTPAREIFFPAPQGSPLVLPRLSLESPQIWPLFLLLSSFGKLSTFLILFLIWKPWFAGIC